MYWYIQVSDKDNSKSLTSKLNFKRSNNFINNKWNWWSNKYDIYVIHWKYRQCYLNLRS